jgi:hypothetical protein
MACARGGLGGFIQGFYANESETVSKDCLGESTFQKLDQFIKMLESGNLMDVFKSFGKMYQFTYDLQKQCRSNEISFEVVGYCLNKTNDCKIETLIANFQKSLFKLTDAANKIAEVLVTEYQTFPTKDLSKLDDAAETYTSLGKSLG